MKPIDSNPTPGKLYRAKSDFLRYVPGGLGYHVQFKKDKLYFLTKNDPKSYNNNLLHLWFLIDKQEFRFVFPLESRSDMFPGSPPFSELFEKEE